MSGDLPVRHMDAESQQMLHHLCMHFRGGMLASVLRVEEGTLFAPPPPPLASTSAAREEEEEQFEEGSIHSEAADTEGGEENSGGQAGGAEAEEHSSPAAPSPVLHMPSEWQTARNTHSPSELCILPCIDTEAVEDPQWEVLLAGVVQEGKGEGGKKRGAMTEACLDLEPPAARRRL